MRSRCLVTACALVLTAAACGGSSSSEDTQPDITLLTTTTVTPPTSTDSVAETTPETSPSTVESVPTPSSVDTVPETTVETTIAPPTSPAGPIVDERFALTTSGLGTTAFGAEPDGVVAYVSAFLGAPTGDTGWVDPFSIGPCGGTVLRQVNWGNLQLEFGDASSVTEGRRHFYAYTYGQEGSSTAVPSGLATPEKITVGSTVGALLATYPSTQLLSADEFTPDSFVVNDEFRGRLSGLTDDDVIELIIGGLPCDG